MNLYWRPHSRRATARRPSAACAPLPAASARIQHGPVPLSIDELQGGLRLLDRMDTDRTEFWGERRQAFMATIRLAIRETAEALLFEEMSYRLRVELETQLAWLKEFAEQASAIEAGFKRPNVPMPSETSSS